MPSYPHLYRIDHTLLQRLMRRTGTGTSISARDLAAAVGIRGKSTITRIVSGELTYCAPDVAHRIAEVIGVDVLIIGTPTRSQPPDESTHDLDVA